MTSPGGTHTAAEIRLHSVAEIDRGIAKCQYVMDNPTDYHVEDRVAASKKKTQLRRERAYAAALDAATQERDRYEAVLTDPVDEIVLAALRAHSQHNPEAYQREGMWAIEVLSMRFAIQAAALAASSSAGGTDTGADGQT